MKTVEELKELFPILRELVATNDHRMGESYWEDGPVCEYEDNQVFYERDGWRIEIFYRCTREFDNDPGDYWYPSCDDLITAHGEVEEIQIYHIDEQTGEETYFEGEEIDELAELLNEVLSDIS